MGDVTVHIDIKFTKTPLVGSDYDVIEAWIKTNVKDKLPTTATEAHSYSIIP